MTVYTIGHSNRTLSEFQSLLRDADVRLVADVRSFPRSRTNPQFNIETLPAALAEFAVGYRHIPELGGRRHRAPDAPPSPNTFWREQAFRNYADYTATDAFKSGMTTLRNLAAGQCCAVMCAEALWWQCHRRIITDYLLVQGFEVRHIMGPHKAECAALTPGARQLADGTLVYP